MRYILIALLVTLALPTGAFAARGPATFSAGRALVAASSSPGNAYLAGVSVVSTAPVAGDISIVGGSVVSAATVGSDELLLAGSASSRAAVAGDLRALAGSISNESTVAGDFIALGYGVHTSGRVSGSTFIMAVNATLTNGSGGPVTVYGNNVTLGGEYAGSVRVVATGRLTLAPGTIIHGSLSYDAPEEAVIPASASILGGIEYTSASYLPDAGTSRLLGLLSIGLFLFARILGALILAGLLAGLFPRLADAVTDLAYTGRPRSILLTMLLGFAILVAAPVLIILLALTFVGMGLALLLFILYALLVLFSFLYAGILVGSMFARRFARRETVLWRDGILGMLALSLIALLPYIGLITVLIFSLFCAGALLLIFFRFAFPHEDHTTELL